MSARTRSEEKLEQQREVVTGLGRHDSQRLGFVPANLRRWIRNQVDDWGRLTSRARMMPSFLIVGAQRSGTSALYEYLVRHPAIGRSTTEEVHYFTHNFDRGVAWYRGHFPTVLRQAYVRRRHGLELICGEATPYYMFHPHAPSRIAELLPTARLIVVLRNPVERAYSHFVHSRRVGVEPIESFEEALDAEPARLAGEVEKMRRDPAYRSRNHWHFSYVTRGIYIDQMEVLDSLFSAHQILVLSADQLLRQTAETHARVLRFLNQPVIALPNYHRHNASPYAPMDPGTRARLVETFAEPNRRLYDFLGVDFGWE
jgi:hypothetical protein